MGDVPRGKARLSISDKPNLLERPHEVPRFEALRGRRPGALHLPKHRYDPEASLRLEPLQGRVEDGARADPALLPEQHPVEGVLDRAERTALDGRERLLGREAPGQERLELRRGIREK